MEVWSVWVFLAFLCFSRRAARRWSRMSADCVLPAWVMYSDLIPLSKNMHVKVHKWWFYTDHMSESVQVCMVASWSGPSTWHQPTPPTPNPPTRLLPHTHAHARLQPRPGAERGHVHGSWIYKFLQPRGGVQPWTMRTRCTRTQGQTCKQKTHWNFTKKLRVFDGVFKRGLNQHRNVTLATY